LPDVILALCATLLTFAAQAVWMGNYIPFAEPYAILEGSGRVNRMVLYLFVSGGLGGCHYALSMTKYGVLIAIPVVAGLAWLLQRRYARRTWSDLITEEAPAMQPARA